MPKNRSKKEIAISLSLVIVPVVVLFAMSILIGNSYTKQAPSEPIIAIETSEPIVIPAESIKNIKIKARAAYVKDLNTGNIIFSKNEDEKLPLASLTKIMTAIVAKKNADDSQLVQITDLDLATEGFSSLHSQEIFRLKDLVNMSMTGSVNHAATAISGILNNKENFIAEMNRTARQAGINDLNFKNETGLDVDINNSSATGSAKDVTALIEFALKNYPDIFDGTTADSITVNSTTGFTHQIRNTNRITGQLGGLIGSKTGYTDLAGGNLAIVIDKGLNEPIAIVVLGSPDNMTRFDDVLAILKEIKK